MIKTAKNGKTRPVAGLCIWEDTTSSFWIHKDNTKTLRIVHKATNGCGAIARSQLPRDPTCRATGAAVVTAILIILETCADTS